MGLRDAGRLGDGLVIRGRRGPLVVDALIFLGAAEAVAPEHVVELLAELDAILRERLRANVVGHSANEMRQGGAERVHPNLALGENLLQVGAHIVVRVPAEGRAQERHRVVDVHAGVDGDAVVVGLHPREIAAVDERDDLVPQHVAVDAEGGPEEHARLVQERGIHEQPERDEARLDGEVNPLHLRPVRPRDKHVGDLALLHDQVVVVPGVGLGIHIALCREDRVEGGGPAQIVSRAHEPRHDHGGHGGVGLGHHLELEASVVQTDNGGDEVVPDKLAVVVNARHGVVPAHGVARQVGVPVQLVLGKLKPAVARLVVQLELPVVVWLRRHAIVLGHTHAPAHNVPGDGAGLHRERARVDDRQVPIRAELGPRAQPADAVDALREVVCALRGHLQLERQLAVAEHERGLGRSPEPKLHLGLFDEDVQAVGVLLHHAEQIHILARQLLRGLVDAVELFHVLAMVRRGLQQRNVHVKVVRLLNGPHQLLHLVLEVAHALGAHHKVVLHLDGQTVPNGVCRIRALGLRKHAGGGLVGHTGRQALIVTPHVPLKLAVWVLKKLIRQDDGRERGAGGVSDEPINAVGEVRIRPFQHVRQMPALVPLVPLVIGFDVASGRPENVLPVCF